MGGNFTVFQSAVSALAANSQALSIAGNNIANVNTPGYSRQVAVLQAKSPQTSGNVELGLGVDVTAVNRTIDSFAEVRLVEATSTSVRYDAESESLQQVAGAFNEIGADGINTFLVNFFNSWQDLSNDATSINSRTNVLNKASTLIDRFHNLANQINDSRGLMDVDIRDRIANINTIADQIGELNNKISAASGESQLSLRDSRQFLVRELAKQVDVSYVETTEGEFQVYIGGGLQLISGTTVNTMGTEENAGNDGHLDVTLTVGGAAASVINTRIEDGALKGILDARDTSLPDYLEKLDELAYRIVADVNTAHSAGFNLDSGTGVVFFTALAAIAGSATSIALSAAVTDAPRKLAAASAAAQLPAGNSVARAIGNLKDTDSAFVAGNATYTSFHSDLLATIGNDTASAQANAEFSMQVERQADLQRERSSGVSLEEEQLNLIKYQAAFQAASRLVGVADEILRQLNELLG